jgi:hypothetical protein
MTNLGRLYNTHPFFAAAMQLLLGFPSLSIKVLCSSATPSRTALDSLNENTTCNCTQPIRSYEWQMKGIYLSWHMPSICLVYTKHIPDIYLEVGAEGPIQANPPAITSQGLVIMVTFLLVQNLDMICCEKCASCRPAWKGKMEANCAQHTNYRQKVLIFLSSAGTADPDIVPATSRTKKA